MIKESEKFREIFVSEASRHVEHLNRALLALEKNPNQLEPVNKLFAEMHALKSMSATMNYSQSVALCHAFEDVLDAIRKKKVKAGEVVRISSLICHEPRTTNNEIRTTSDEFEHIQAIEVKVERLDRLMNLSEELLTTKLRLDRVALELQNPELSAVAESFDRLIADLQYNVMQSRTVPLGFVFDRFPRMVRDLAKLEKKEVDF